MKPDLNALENCISELAILMKMQPLSKEKCINLIEYVLFGGSDSKQAWLCLSNNILTEREVRNFLLAHAVTRISSFNNAQEPSTNQYHLIDLINKVDLALYGRDAKLLQRSVTS